MTVLLDTEALSQTTVWDSCLCKKENYKTFFAIQANSQEVLSYWNEWPSDTNFTPIFSTSDIETKNQKGFWTPTLPSHFAD
jgi:hypothetical protein